MKVFEIITEHCEGDSKEITTTQLYVTCNTNLIEDVAKYYAVHCEQYEKDLKSVREVITIVENIVM